MSILFQTQSNAWIPGLSNTQYNASLNGQTAARLTFVKVAGLQFNGLTITNASAVQVECRFNGDATRPFSLPAGQTAVFSPPTDILAFDFLDIFNMSQATAIAASLITATAQTFKRGI